MIAGNTSMPNPAGGTMVGNAGNGYVRVTSLQPVQPPNATDGYFDYVGAPQTFTASENGYYQIELWGGAGGQSVCDGVVCGTAPSKGAYTKGMVYL
jgi:hypothetical protein